MPDDLDLGQRLALLYQTDTGTISVPATVTGLGLPAVRVETEAGEVFIRNARKLPEWTTYESRHA